MDEIQHSKPVPPFVRYCAANIPMVFDDSLSYYEALCALWKWLQTDVIDIINNNASVTEQYIAYDLQTRELFIQLKDYVDNYFDNLDVQEEINNKLDAMVEDGTLQEIIENYLQPNVTWTFDTVADMKVATNLINGCYARTLGYHSVNDGGSAIYKITDSGTANEMDVIACGELYATIVSTSAMTFEQFGAYGDGTHDDTSVVNYVLGSSTNYDIKPLPKVYAVASRVEIYYGKSVDFNNATIKGLTDDMVVIYYYQESMDYTYAEKKGGISNLIIDCNNKASTGLYAYTWQKEFENIRIYNVHQYGIWVDGGYENHYNNIRLSTTSANPSAIGFVVKAGDNTFDNLTGVDIKTFWQDYGKFNQIGNMHAWILTPSLSVNSKFIECQTTTNIVIDFCYSDTYHYAIYNTAQEATTNSRWTINTLWSITHPSNFAFSQAHPIIFSYHTNSSLGKMHINTLHVESVSAEKNTVLLDNRNSTEDDLFSGVIEDYYIQDTTTSKGNLSSTFGLSSLNAHITGSPITNFVRQTGRMVEIDFVAQVDTSFTGSQVVGTIPSFLAPQGLTINYVSFLASVDYGYDNTSPVSGYLFIGDNGQISVRKAGDTDLSTYKYLKLHIVYMRRP